MNKKGMNLTTLAIVIFVVIALMYISTVGLTKTNLVSMLIMTGEDVELLNVQQLANMAYSSIYLDNLRQGVRRELTSQEIRVRMLKNGVGDIDLDKYIIKVNDGDVFVTLKEEQ